MSVNGTPRKITQRLRLELLGGFRLVVGRAPVATSLGAERLLTFVALHPPAVRRAFAAGALWPDVSESRSYACLRSALARLDDASRSAIDLAGLDLGLARTVQVDFRAAEALAHRIVQRTEPMDSRILGAEAIATLSTDLLPGWYEEWVASEAEDWRRLRIHALEALSAQLADAGHLSVAAAAACAAVRAEPLRESARVALIRVQLAEGNQFEAVREFHQYEQLLRCELDVRPTRRLRELIAELATSDRQP